MAGVSPDQRVGDPASLRNDGPLRASAVKVLQEKGYSGATTMVGMEIHQIRQYHLERLKGLSPLRIANFKWDN